MDPANSPAKRKRQPVKSPPHTGESTPEPLDTLSEKARLAKIAKLKQAIADGTYHIDSDEVARKIIEHMLEPKD